MVEWLVLGFSLAGAGASLIHYLRTSWRRGGNIEPGDMKALERGSWISLFGKLNIRSQVVLTVLSVREGRVTLKTQVTPGDKFSVLKIYKTEGYPRAIFAAQRELMALNWLYEAHAEATQDSELQCLVLQRDWFPGGSLLDYLKRRGPLDLSQVDRVISHVSREVARVHDCGLIHCDIKPANIISDWSELVSGKPSRVYLVDFEMSEISEPRRSFRDPVKLALSMGTPTFTAPERLFRGEVSHASDIYSLARVAETLISPLSLERDPAYQRLASVLGRALEIDPMRRTSSAQEFLREWGEALSLIGQDSDCGQIRPAYTEGSASPLTIYTRTLSRSSIVSVVREAGEIDPELVGDASERELQLLERYLMAPKGEDIPASSDERAELYVVLKSIEKRVAIAEGDDLPEGIRTVDLAAEDGGNGTAAGPDLTRLFEWVNRGRRQK